MDEKDVERKVDEFGAKADNWASSLPLPVRLLGDIICSGVTVYIVAWIIFYFGLFGLTSPNTWAFSTWAYILIAILVISVIYELFSNDMRLWKRYFRKK